MSFCTLLAFTPKCPISKRFIKKGEAGEGGIFDVD